MRCRCRWSSFVPPPERLQEVLKQQFDLVYYGHFTDVGIDSMPVREREAHYRRLAEKKRQERDDNERAAAQSQAR